MKRRTLCISISLVCAIMAVVDGILQPGYLIKSAIKIVLFLAVPFLLSIRHKPSIFRVFSLDRPAIITGCVLCVSTYAVIMGCYWLLHPYLDLSTVPQALEQSAGVNGNNFLFVGTYIALCNSLLEEFFFRGFVFLSLADGGNKLFAHCFSSLTFALYHAGMLITMISPLLFILALVGLFFCGLLLNYLNVRRKTIWTSWLLHMGANLAINTVGMILLGMI